MHANLRHCFPFQWTSTDVSNVDTIGDNYESEVLFLVTGYQYIASAMAYNFGYEFRQAWCRNYLFVALATLFTCLHFYSALNVGKLSCIWRVNCINENVVSSIDFYKKSIQNVFNTTVMPDSFRRGLVLIMTTNAIAIVGWDFFVVNGIRKHFAAKRRTAMKDDSSESETSIIKPDA